MYTAKVHKEGPDNLVVESGGTIEVKNGGSVTGITTATIIDGLTSTDATKALSAKQGKLLKDAVDVVDAKVTAKVAANQIASTEATSPTVAEFNALLSALKTAGLMVTDA